MFRHCGILLGVVRHFGNPLSPTIIAAFWMVGALFSFTAMAIGGREVSAQISTFEILFFRSVIGLVIVGFFLLKSDWKQILTQHLPLHIIRNLAHFGGQYGWFYGIALIPLAEVFAIEFTVPVWTAIFATFMLKERLTQSRITVIGLGVLGMLIILRPGIAVVNPAALVVLSGAMGYAFSHTLTKKLAHKDTPLTILFYMTVIQLPLGLVLSLPNWVTPTVEMWPWLLIIGITALSAHYCLTRALKLADATVVVPMDFLRLPLIALVGFIFYQEALEWFVLAGVLVMLGGNYTNIRAEHQLNKRNAAQRNAAQRNAAQRNAEMSVVRQSDHTQ